MAEVSYINPLSDEGRGIIRGYGDLNQIFSEDETLVEMLAILYPRIKKIMDTLDSIDIDKI